MASLVVTAHYNTSVSEEILCSLLGLLVTIRPIVTVVLAVARSSANIFNTVYRFITVTNAFFNILINLYIVCE